jgi:fatty-acyl-CoA synthase
MDGGIGDWVARRALRGGENTALVDPGSGRRVDYAELHRRTDGIAAGLRARGVRAGDRVALLMDNTAEHLELLFAVAKAGAIAVPINVRLSAAEVGFVLADSGAETLAVTPRFAELAAAGMRSGGAVAAVIATEGAEVADAPATVALDELAAEPAAPAGVVAPGQDDVCVIMYTSGTTGRPKGAMLTHGNMLWNAINALTMGYGLSSADTTVAAAPLFHIGALGLSALPIIYAGGTVVLQRAFDPAETLRLMAEERVTTQFLVPAMWAAVSQVPGIEDYDLTELRYVLSGGAPAPLPVIEFFQQLGWTFLEGFGMTELSPGAACLDSAHVVSHAGSVGRPVMHVDAKLVDGDGREAAPGEVGELLLRGPTVFAGYWNQPDATAEVLADGWFRSGDLGRADAEGFITLVDRKKDMIITGGENVYPVEVEQVLHRHPGIADVAVIGVGDAQWGESVMAVVVPAEGEPATAEDIIGFARERIAHFKCPRRVELVDELPRNATGKILKRSLREAYAGAAEAVHR